MHDIAFIVAGFFVGAIVGLTGVGGGSLMTPILIFVFGIKPALAIGTDLLFAAFTKMGGTIKTARSRQVPWPVVLQLSAGSIPAALVTLWMLKHVGQTSAEIQRVMSFTLGVALLLTAAATLYKALSKKAAQQHILGAGTAQAYKARHWSLPLLFGVLIGTLVTLTSVGAGAIGVTVLTLLYPRLPLSRVVAGDIAYAVPLTLVAGLGHASLGLVDWPLLGLLLMGSLPGIWFGSYFVARVPERISRSLLSLLLAYVGLKLVHI